MSLGSIYKFLKHNKQLNSSRAVESTQNLEKADEASTSGDRKFVVSVISRGHGIAQNVRVVDRSLSPKLEQVDYQIGHIYKGLYSDIKGLLKKLCTSLLKFFKKS